MSQQAYNPMAAPREETNGLGIAGFVCSLIGLVFTGGLLCPVGLILSLVALGRRPRGFAIAGVIVGLLGTCGIGIFVIMAIAVGAAAVVATVAGLAGVMLFFEQEKVEITTDMAWIAIAAESYEEENGVLPADLDLLDLEPSILTDPWGSPYRYLLVELDPGFDLISAGRDGQFETEDDVALSRLDEAWGTAINDLDQKIEEFEKEHGGTTIEVDPDYGSDKPAEAETESSDAGDPDQG